MKALPKKYDHNVTEKQWQSQWVQDQTYAWDENTSREESYVIDTPPPTVSGLLHMGHIFSYTQADFVARFQRMNGKNVFYPMGFDDNGLPTERLVEKVKKVRATDMTREEFTALCEGVAEGARKDFRELFESVALSVDWKQEYHTISDDSRTISQMSFLDLFHKDKAYRKLQPMLWDPVDQTAIAQAEVEDKEHDSFMNHIHFGVEGSDEKVTIATTRPELLAACVAVFYHPDDTRYQHLKGKQAVTALFGVKVPFLADENVKMDKGTGLVMCCTFGDETDILWWRTHELPTRVLLNKYGKIAYEEVEGIEFLSSTKGSKLTSENTVDITKAIEYLTQIQNKKAAAAREIMIECVKEAGLLVKQEPITHAVKCAERSGAPLEILPTHQWFIKILDQKAELKAKAAECNWYPEYMKVRVDQWIDGLSWDWCVSRQRYFGVPFPIWYSKRAGEEGKILVAEKDQLPVNPLADLPKGYTRDEVEPEADVMDTWATSSVSPQLSSKAITEDYAIDLDRHNKLFPADLRPQAHEIIRTWAFYTIAKAHLHEDTIPWKNLMISGWCLASDKTKMSKSKGNVVTPVHLIEEKGSDVVRYWASTSHLGADTAYSEDVLKIGKKLVTKLWNASKFAAIQLEKLEGEPSTAYQDVADRGIIFHTLDLWLLTRLHKATRKATEEFQRYEYCRAREAVEDFFWNDLCDNYLEMIKARAYGEAEGISKADQQSAIYTIYHALEAVLRLLAPIVPHITEELYSHIFDDRYAAKGSIHGRNRWPIAGDFPLREEAEEAGIASVAVLNAIRKLKAEKNVSIKWPLEQIAVKGEGADKISKTLGDLKFVSNAAEITLDETLTNAQSCQTDDGRLEISAVFAKESDAA